MTQEPPIYQPGLVLVDHGDEEKGDDLAGEPCEGEVDLSDLTFVDVDDDEVLP